MKRIALLMLLLACGETGQEQLQLPLTATGSSAHAIALGDAQLTITRADVAFGPLYLCASEAGRAELCEVALAEFLGTVTVRALDPNAQPVGVLDATTGGVRSGLFDYGISWLLPDNAARANPGAVEGHSAIVEAIVTRGAQSVRMRATIDISPRMGGDSAVNGQVTRFQLTGAQNSLNIAFDPHPWLSNLDADALFALDTDGDGAVEVPTDGPLHESILQGMTSRAPPVFQWR